MESNVNTVCVLYNVALLKRALFLWPSFVSVCIINFLGASDTIYLQRIQCHFHEQQYNTSCPYISCSLVLAESFPSVRFFFFFDLCRASVGSLIYSTFNMHSEHQG